VEVGGREVGEGVGLGGSGVGVGGRGVGELGRVGEDVNSGVKVETSWPAS